MALGWKPALAGCRGEDSMEAECREDFLMKKCRKRVSMAGRCLKEFQREDFLTEKCRKEDSPEGTIRTAPGLMAPGMTGNSDHILRRNT